MATLLSELQVASYLAYSPKDQSAEGGNSRLRMRAIKQDRAWRHKGPLVIDATAERIAQDTGAPFGGFLGPEAVLVPVPRHSLQQPGSLWPPLRIAEALQRQGLGRDVVPLIKRESPVTKAATALSGKRPTALEHFESMSVELLDRPDRITLVDDVVTRGATLIGAASRILTELPDAEITAFCLLRVESDELTGGIRNPRVETITLGSDGHTYRR